MILNLHNLEILVITVSSILILLSGDLYARINSQRGVLFREEEVSDDRMKFMIYQSIKIKIMIHSKKKGSMPMM